MADRVLYFPSIQVPKGEWFARVLLCWDSVSTIVPAEYLDDPHFLRPYTAELIDCHLLETKTPDEAMWSSGAHNYWQAFLDLVDRHPLLVTHRPLAERSTTRIHTDKTGTGLAAALQERGLARFLAGPEYSSWFEVEKQTADLLMAYLATILARGSEQATDPITDRQECLAAFQYVGGKSSLADSTEGVITETEPVRTEIIQSVLPAPYEIIRVAELAEFKARHRELLTRFRRTIEQKIIEVAAIDDRRLRARQLELVKKELQGQVDEIIARMKESRWRRIGLGTIAAVVAGGVALADAAMTGGTLTMTAGSIGLISAVYGAFSGTKTPRELLERPMAYAALARRAFA